VRTRVHQLLQSAGRDANTIPDSEIKLYCKNSRFLNFIRFRSLVQEHSKESVLPLEIGWYHTHTDCRIPHLHSTLHTYDYTLTSCGTCLESEGDQIDNKVFYLALRAAERFNTLHGHYPGNIDVDQDLAKFQEVVLNILSELSLPTTTVPESVVHEV
jgi:hypothetical protein